MSYRTARSLFDGSKFRADVIAYMDRWRLSGRGLAAESSSLGVTAVREFLRGDREPTLLMVCELADVCDLSLDSYRTTG